MNPDRHYRFMTVLPHSFATPLGGGESVADLSRGFDAARVEHKALKNHEQK